MSEVLKLYIPLIKFLGVMLGADVEIVLYDTLKQNVCWVENPFDEDMIPGSEIRSLERNMMQKKSYKDKEYLINYRTLSKEKHYKLRSATMFIKNEKKELIGMMTVNHKVDKLIEVRELLETLVNGPKTLNSKMDRMFFESQEDNSFETLIKETISEEIKAFNVPPERLTYHEKMLLMSRLEKKGVLLMKGSVSEIARMLKTTEPSIYRYISKLNES